MQGIVTKKTKSVRLPDQGTCTIWQNVFRCGGKTNQSSHVCLTLTPASVVYTLAFQNEPSLQTQVISRIQVGEAVCQSDTG